jgi:ribonuclease Z
MKITFLGTSGSTPTKERGMPSVALEHDGEIFLFDCGEGAQRQMMNYGVNISRIKAIFVTHTHGDHIIGIAGLLRTMALYKRTAPLCIYVPKGEESKIKVLITFDRALIQYGIEIVGIGTGTVYKGKDFSIEAFRLNHSIPTLGYAFRETDKLKFNKAKSSALGLEGMMFKEIEKKGMVKIGNKTVKLKEVTSIKKGRCVVYATDTRPTASTVKASTGADILIHETSFSKDLLSHAKERYHSTAEEAAQVAKKARCKRLFLFHMSARYKDATPLLKEARQIFNNTEVSKDGMQVSL